MSEVTLQGEKGTGIRVLLLVDGLGFGGQPIPDRVFGEQGLGFGRWGEKGTGFKD